MAGHDIVVIGGSAGAIEGVRQIVRQLPRDLPAALFVAIHTTPYTRSALPEMLSKAGPLPARHCEDRQPIKLGHICVAPPDHHLLVGDGFIRVVQGPKENGTRPAIDPLFRTAAASYGPRVLAVLLSGTLDDGTSGLAVIKRQGGVAVVQDPQDALYPEMTANALQHVAVDYCLPLAALAQTLVRLVHEPVNEKERPVSKELAYQVAMAAWDLDALQGRDRPGRPSPFVCPNCKGDLWEAQEDNHTHFRCRTGHAFSPLTLAAQQAAALDATLNEAFRALKEKEHLEQRLANWARSANNGPGADYHEQQAKNAGRHAAILWEILLRFEDLASGPSGDEVQRQEK